VAHDRQKLILLTSGIMQSFFKAPPLSFKRGEVRRGRCGRVRGLRAGRLAERSEATAAAWGRVLVSLDVVDHPSHT
jgi:hypothetical protein